MARLQGIPISAGATPELVAAIRDIEQWVLDRDQEPRALPAFTVAQLATLDPAEWTGCAVIITDEPGGRTVATSDGSSWVRVAPGWQFVSATAITATTNLDVTSLAAGYDYRFSIQGALPATDNVTIECRLSQSASFLSGAGDYEDGAAATSLTLTGAIGNVSDEGCNLEVALPQPNVGSKRKRVLSTWVAADTAGNEQKGVAGGRLDLNTNAVDGIRFFCSAGDFTATGTLYVFRRKLS